MNHRTPDPKLYAVPYTTDSFNGMPYVRLGRSGLMASKVGLGTWKMGHPATGDGSRTDEKESLRILDRAFELGVAFWDTANRYNNASGNSERVIGTWLEHNPDERRSVVIATKVFGGMDGRTPNHCRAGRLNVVESVKACLARLGTDYIDLLYFHQCDPETPVEESLSAVEDLVASGRVRYFGGSNFTRDQLVLYAEAEERLSIRCRVVAVQNNFDVLSGEREQERGVLDYCAREGVSFVAWSPLARGLLTDRYIEPSKAKKGDRLVDEGSLQKDATAGKLAKVKRLAALAKEWGMETSQLALAYMLSLPGMGPVIPSASSVRQVESNAAAGKVSLSAEQRARAAKALGEEG